VEYLEKAIARMDQKPDLMAQLSKDEFHHLRSSFMNLLRQFVKALQHNISMEGYLVHEINTPLTVARNKIEEVESRHKIDMGDVKNILSNLAKFAQDFLSWASLQYIPVENTQVFAIDVAEFCRKTVADLKPIYGERVKLTVKSPARAFASLSDMEHILQNLIVNALKYSPTTEDVLIEVQEDGVSVKDSGPGLSDEVMKSLGKPFNYGPHSPTSGKSTGMGLALVCAVANRYNWKLSFTANKPRGLTATIHFATEKE
jgi:signal transduction histidine kinase